MHPDRSLTRLKAIAAIVLATGLVVAGCSSADKAQPTTSATTASPSGTPSASATKKQSDAACDIVSDEVVSSVLGVEIVRREGKVTTEGSATAVTCIKGLARSNEPSGFTFVSAAVLDDGGQATALLDQAVSGMGGTSVSGLGDRAVFAASGGVLFVIKGAKVVQGQVIKAGKPGTLQQCTAVAKDMLDRL